MTKCRSLLIALGAIVILVLFFENFYDIVGWFESESGRTRQRLWNHEQCYGESMMFESSDNQKGVGFSCVLYPILKRLNLINIKHESPAKIEPSEVPFILYASRNHFAEVKLAIRQIREISSNRIIFYDLGLEEEYMRREIMSVCNLDFRVFNPYYYQRFTEDLSTYSFKPIIMAEVYQSTPVFWMIDSSVRFANESVLKTLYKMVATDPVVDVLTRPETGHSTLAVTHPDMYKYLPMATEIAVLEADTAVALVRRSTRTTEILKWLLLCGLTEDCISPEGAQLRCNFGEDRYKHYAHCHRYDLSALNIIGKTLRLRQGVSSHMSKKINEVLRSVFTIERGTTFKGRLDIDCT